MGYEMFDSLLTALVAAITLATSPVTLESLQYPLDVSLAQESREHTAAEKRELPAWSGVQVAEE